MQQREDFLAALTHDLKNPLIGATKILELFVAGAFNERQDEQEKALNLLEIIFDNPVELPLIKSDKTLLRRVLVNLIDNEKATSHIFERLWTRYD